MALTPALQVTESLIEQGIPWHIPIDVYGPPCTRCQHWRPVVVIKKGGHGYRLCSALKMANDFSCYQPQPDPTEVSD